MYHAPAVAPDSIIEPARPLPYRVAADAVLPRKRRRARRAATASTAVALATLASAFSDEP